MAAKDIRTRRAKDGGRKQQTDEEDESRWSSMQHNAGHIACNVHKEKETHCSQRAVEDATMLIKAIHKNEPHVFETTMPTMHAQYSLESRCRLACNV